MILFPLGQSCKNVRTKKREKGRPKTMSHGNLSRRFRNSGSCRPLSNSGGWHLLSCTLMLHADGVKWTSCTGLGPESPLLITLGFLGKDRQSCVGLFGSCLERAVPSSLISGETFRVLGSEICLLCFIRYRTFLLRDRRTNRTSRPRFFFVKVVSVFTQTYHKYVP